MKVIKQSVFDTWGIEDKSMQAIITSPPYYALRRYDIPDVTIGGNSTCEHEWGDRMATRKRGSAGSKSSLQGGNLTQNNCNEGTTLTDNGGFCRECNAWQGQYGLEPDFKLYVEHTRLWAKEAWRVLRDNGVFFLNIADSYNGSGGAHKEHHKNDASFQGSYSVKTGGNPVASRGYSSKCQLLVPHRVAMALIDDGWILRNTIIWNKPNAMPESVTDRFSKKYEYVFMFVKQSKYYFDLDAVREPLKDTTISRYDRGYNVDGERGYVSGPQNHIKEFMNNPGAKASAIEKGKNPGDVWGIPTQPSSEEHFAMWPEKLVERMILCSTKVGDTVLDPFAGSGTTLRVADKLNRIGQGIDLGYSEIQSRRLAEIQKELIYETV